MGEEGEQLPIGKRLIEDGASCSEPREREKLVIRGRPTRSRLLVKSSFGSSDCDLQARKRGIVEATSIKTRGGYHFAGRLKYRKGPSGPSGPILSLRVPVISKGLSRPVTDCSFVYFSIQPSSTS